MAFFCAAIRWDSLSLIRFPYRNHVQIFLWSLSGSESSQVSWTLKCSSWFEQYCGWGRTDSSSELHFLQSLFQILCDCSKSFNIISRHHHPYISQLFCSLARSRYLSIFFTFFYFDNMVRWNETTKFTTLQDLFFFFLTNARSGLLVEIGWSIFISKSLHFIMLDLIIIQIRQFSRGFVRICFYALVLKLIGMICLFCVLNSLLLCK